MNALDPALAEETALPEARDRAAEASPPLVDSRFVVPSIRCAGCIAKIERELPKMAGIEGARVHFSAKRVSVRHQDHLDEDDLLRAFDQIGFEARPLADDPLAIDEGETRELLRALAVAGFGMMNVMLFSVSVWAGADGSTRQLFEWLSALIALPVIVYSGRPFFTSAWTALRHGRTNMDVPISIGVILTAALSLYETALGGGHAYFESAVMLLFFLLAGRALDATMRRRTRSGIAALLRRMGKSANVIAPDGSTRRLAAEALEPGMEILVAAGESFAADGVIVEGESRIDNSLLTGESLAERVMPGDKVHAGAINCEAPLRVRLSAVAQDTALAEIARLMDEAAQSRSRYVRIADRAARAYAPLVHSLALLALVGWLWAGAGWHGAVVIAVSVLIITCPCAIGLAVPSAQVVACGALLKRGVLVKDGSALERFAECDLAIFDKTGTLTLGEARAQIDRLDPSARAVALALAQASAHPLSRALARALREAGVEPARLDDVRECAGEGVFARWRGEEVALERPDAGEVALAVRLRIGPRREVIRFSDRLRPDAHEALDALRAMGIECRILSGDRSDHVMQIARELGIEAVAGASPQDKLRILEELRAQGRKVLMVGDGLNDAPSLAAAHASIAPARASDASQQSADAVFIGESLMAVTLAVRAARATMRIVRQNFAIATVYNALAVPLALAGLVTPLVAAIAMSASSLVVVGNSLRLARAAR